MKIYGHAYENELFPFANRENENLHPLYCGWILILETISYCISLQHLKLDSKTIRSKSQYRTIAAPICVFGSEGRRNGATRFQTVLCPPSLKYANIDKGSREKGLEIALFDPLTPSAPEMAKIHVMS